MAKRLDAFNVSKMQTVTANFARSNKAYVAAVTMQIVSAYSIDHSASGQLGREHASLVGLRTAKNQSVPPRLPVNRV